MAHGKPVGICLRHALTYECRGVMGCVQIGFYGQFNPKELLYDQQAALGELFNSRDKIVYVMLRAFCRTQYNKDLRAFFSPRCIFQGFLFKCNDNEWWWFHELLWRCDEKMEP